MNLTAIIRLQKKIAASAGTGAARLSPVECNFILNCINIAIAAQTARVADDMSKLPKLRK